MGCVRSSKPGRGSGSAGTSPRRLASACDAGFGWWKQAGALVAVVTAGCPGLLGEGGGREKPRGPGRAVASEDLGSLSSFLKKKKKIHSVGFF